MKSILKGVFLIILIISCFQLLRGIENNNYKKAIEKCNGKENVITKYTNSGDRYFICKVEK